LRTPGIAAMPANGAVCSTVMRSIVVSERLEEKSGAESFACAGGDLKCRGKSACVHCRARYAVTLEEPETEHASSNRQQLEQRPWLLTFVSQ
jgi:hypothetical protein